MPQIDHKITSQQAIAEYDEDFEDEFRRIEHQLDLLAMWLDFTDPKLAPPGDTSRSSPEMAAVIGENAAALEELEQSLIVKRDELLAVSPDQGERVNRILARVRLLRDAIPEHLRRLIAHEPVQRG